MKNIKPYIIILVIGMLVSLLLPKSQSNQFGVSGITIPQGGTGMTSVPAGEVLIGYNQMRLQSTTTPTFTWMTTSSSTQSSIFAGKVGIGTTSPFAKLSVAYDSLTTSKVFSAGTGTSTLQIASDGSLELTGDATVWEDLRFPATAINPAGLTGPMTFDQTNIGFTAGASATTSIAVVAQMPHSWKLGSSIYPHFHWEPTTADTGNVVWNIEYKWTGINETTSANWTYLQTIQAGSGTAWTHQLASIPAISGTGKGLSSLLTIKISRAGAHGSDTYADDALLKEFDIHYEIDSMGSRNEISK